MRSWSASIQIEYSLACLDRVLLKLEILRTAAIDQSRFSKRFAGSNHIRGVYCPHIMASFCRLMMQEANDATKYGIRDVVCWLACSEEPAPLLLAACGQATMTGEPQEEMAEKPADTQEAGRAGDGHAQRDLLHGSTGRRLSALDRGLSGGGRRRNIDLSIDVTAWGEYWPKLKTSAAAGTPFDVMIMNGPNIMFHAANNILYDLSPYVAADNIDMLETFPAYLVNVYTLFGKVWGLPNFHATIGMYYNREHLGEAGLDEPAEDWTFDDWLEMSQKLTKRQGETPERWGTYVSVWGQTEGYNYVLANGGEI